MKRLTIPAFVMVVALLLAVPVGAVQSNQTGWISGRVVTSDGQGQEGVWVIAESWDLMPNDGRLIDRYRKIVVTGDNGKFVVPELPKGATYNIWVRGYGLADSKPSHRVPGTLWASPGDHGIVVEVERAETPQEAAQVYPANYWMSLMDLPSEDQFPGDGEYIAAGMKSLDDFMGTFHLQCQLCHQMGTEATRLPSREAFDIGLKKAARMDGASYALGRDALLDMLGDWGERIYAGEVPPQPPRPEGIERNVVITEWEFGSIYTYVHDTVSSDWRDPTMNPYGPVYGTDIANDWLYILEPTKNSWSRVRIPAYKGNLVKGYYSLGDPTPEGHTTFDGAFDYSAAYSHTPVMDENGVIWQATHSLGNYEPEMCEGTGGSMTHSITAYYPDTEEFAVIPVCFGTHHIAIDDDGIIWANGDTTHIGWLDPDKLDPDDIEGTMEDAQDWEKVVVDSDGDGGADTPLTGFTYSVSPSPDGSVWFGYMEANPGRILRFDPETRTFEVYSPPEGSRHFGSKGIWTDSEGNVWMPTSGSGGLARFDRSQCEQTWGTGDQCPEGWTFWDVPGPTFQGTDRSTNFSYYIWVDRYNASGLGKDTVMLMGTNTDAITVFDPETEEFHHLRVPYPLGMFTRFADARIDDPDAGWKGRGIWTAYQTTSALHTETRRPSFVKIQVRPNPYAH